MGAVCCRVNHKQEVAVSGCIYNAIIQNLKMKQNDINMLLNCVMWKVGASFVSLNKSYKCILVVRKI